MTEFLEERRVPSLSGPELGSSILPEVGSAVTGLLTPAGTSASVSASLPAALDVAGVATSATASVSVEAGALSQPSLSVGVSVSPNLSLAAPSASILVPVTEVSAILDVGLSTNASVTSTGSALLLTDTAVSVGLPSSVLGSGTGAGDLSLTVSDTLSLGGTSLISLGADAAVSVAPILSGDSTSLLGLLDVGGSSGSGSTLGIDTTLGVSLLSSNLSVDASAGATLGTGVSLSIGSEAAAGSSTLGISTGVGLSVGSGSSPGTLIDVNVTDFTGTHTSADTPGPQPSGSGGNTASPGGTQPQGVGGTPTNVGPENPTIDGFAPTGFVVGSDPASMDTTTGKTGIVVGGTPSLPRSSSGTTSDLPYDESFSAIENEQHIELISDVTDMIDEAAERELAVSVSSDQMFLHMAPGVDKNKNLLRLEETSGAAGANGTAQQRLNGSPGDGESLAVSELVQERTDGPRSGLLPSDQPEPSELEPTDFESLERALGLFLARLDAMGDNLGDWLMQVDLLSAILAAGSVALASELIRRRIRRRRDLLKQNRGKTDTLVLPGPLYLARA